MIPAFQAIDLARSATDPYGPAMGFAHTDWTATWNGHAVKVHRSELTRGFTVEVAGKVAVKRAMTLTGGGHFEGDVEIDGSKVLVVVELVNNTECDLTIAGEKLVVTHVS